MHKLFASHSTMQAVEGENIFLSYKVIGKLGAGNSTVYSVQKEIVIKSEQNMKDFMREIQLMKQMSKQQHKNIIGFYDYCILIRESEYENLRLGYMLLELAITSLDKLISSRMAKKLYFSTQLIRTFMVKCVEVHRYLQEQKIAHCDIKPENILITDVECLEFKICDIGSGKLIKNENTANTTIAGTIPFLSPELMSSLSCNKINHNPFKSDVYSLGLCMLYLITFNKFSQTQRSVLSEGAFFDVVDEWKRQAFAICENDPLVVLMLDNMLIIDQKSRPDFFKLHALTVEADSPEMYEVPLCLGVRSFEESEPSNTPKTMTMHSDFSSTETPMPRSRMIGKKSNFASQSPASLTKHIKNSQSTNNFGVRSNDSIFRITAIKKSVGGQILPQKTQQQLQPINVNNSPIRKKSLRTAEQLVPIPRTMSIMTESQTQSQFFQSPFKVVPSQHMLTESPQRTVRRKGNSAGQIPPLDVRSMQSTKSSFFTDSPGKKLRPLSVMQTSHSVRIVNVLSSFKELLEFYVEGWQDQPELKLIIYIDQSRPDSLQMVTEIARLTMVRDLSIVLIERRLKGCSKNAVQPLLGKLLSSVQTLCDLETLELRLERITFTESDVFVVKLPKLVTLHLEILKCNTDKRSCYNLFQALVGLNKPKYLTLKVTFIGLDNINPFTDLLGPQLVYLHLEFANINIDHNQHKKLYDVLSQLPSLTTLIITFHCCTLNLKQAQWSLNPRLTELILTYHKSYADQGLTSLSLGLQMLTKIRNLELAFNNQVTQPQILKLLAQYIGKLTNLKELKLNFDNVNAIDNQMVSCYAEKLRSMSQLEVLSISLISNNVTSLDPIWTLLTALIPQKTLQQFEISVPRSYSALQLKEKCPSSMEMRVNYIDIDTIGIILFDQQLLGTRIEYHAMILDVVLNNCSEKDYSPLFSCLDCPPANHICLQCARSCHGSHRVVLRESVPRYGGTYSKLRACQCTYEGCNSAKKQACLSVFGDALQIARTCQTCPNPEKYLCMYCCLTSHSTHCTKTRDVLVTNDCS